METLPTINGDNGREPGGRFAKGNPGGPGNPHARRTAEIRATLIDAVSDADLVAMIHTLIAQAKAGDVAAAREVLDRVLGKAKVSVAIEGPPEPTAEELQRELAMLVRENPEVLVLLRSAAG